MYVENLQICMIMYCVLKMIKNHGVSYTRNHGLDYAEGTYLMFVDSDDYVVEDYVETMVTAVSDTEDEKIIPVCGYINHDEKKTGRTDIFLPSDERENLKKSIEIMPELYEKECYRLSGIKFLRIRCDKTESYSI